MGQGKFLAKRGGRGRVMANLFKKVTISGGVRHKIDGHPLHRFFFGSVLKLSIFRIIDCLKCNWEQALPKWIFNWGNRIIGLNRTKILSARKGKIRDS